MPEKRVIRGEDITFKACLKGGANQLLRLFCFSRNSSPDRPQKKNKCTQTCDEILGIIFCGIFLIFLSGIPISFLWIYFWTYLFPPIISWTSIAPFVLIGILIGTNPIAPILLTAYGFLVWFSCTFFRPLIHFFVYIGVWTVVYAFSTTLIVYILSCLYYYSASKAKFRKATRMVKTINLQLSKKFIMNCHKEFYEPRFQHSELRMLKDKDPEMFQLVSQLMSSRHGYGVYMDIGFEIFNFSGDWLATGFQKNWNVRRMEMEHIFKEEFGRDLGGVFITFIFADNCVYAGDFIIDGVGHQRKRYTRLGDALTFFYGTSNNRQNKPRQIYEMNTGLLLDWGYDEFLALKELETSNSETSKEQKSSSCIVM